MLVPWCLVLINALSSKVKKQVMDKDLQKKVTVKVGPEKGPLENEGIGKVVV